MDLKDTCQDRLEVCVSNNCSTDNSSDVLLKWQQPLSLLCITQSSNLGASQNMLEVLRLATGRWTLIIGDDDEISLEDFQALMGFLESVGTDTWILVGVSDSLGRGNLLGTLVRPAYSSNQMKRELVKRGVYSFGFIGMHIYPERAKNDLLGLPVDALRPWPHLVGMLRHMRCNNFAVFCAPVIRQAGGGAVLSWQLSDWVKVNLKKLDFITQAQGIGFKQFIFTKALFLRELYSFRNIKDVIRWRISDGSGFSKEVFPAYFSRYGQLGLGALACVPHFMFLFVLVFFPKRAFELALRAVGKLGVLNRSAMSVEAVKEDDGVKRGL